jgi:predicted ThiF/HesA family dinucleotide-utilizing enzyme
MRKIKVILAIFTMMTAGVFGFIKTAHAEKAAPAGAKVATIIRGGPSDLLVASSKSIIPIIPPVLRLR